jgi:regulator of protease activity HflC (stomatin/prohibitin superfamily)
VFLIPWIVVAGVLLVLLFSAINIIPEYQRGVVFRLGRLTPVRGPGLVLIIPGIDRLVRLDLRTVALDVPRQDVITRDNVSVAVNAVVYFRVLDPVRATVSIENFLFATSQLAQTTLRSVVGQEELDSLLADRERINRRIQEILDVQTDPWGIKVSQVEVKHIDLPESMQRAMARQAEAERERRAKIIAAEGEHQAAQRLTDAARTLDQTPTALQLRYLQTLVEISAEQNSTILFPIPLDLVEPFLRAARRPAEPARERPAAAFE